MYSPAPVTQSDSENKVFATSLDAALPIQDIRTDEGKHRLSCRVSYDHLPLGSIEVPVFEGFVSSYVLQDAIAAEFAWEILGEYFRHTLYPLFAKAQNDGPVPGAEMVASNRLKLITSTIPPSTKSRDGRFH